MTTKRSVFVGRFNPFHRGHLQAIKHILTQVDELIIAIGSAQESHTLTNPFTAGERVFMIHESFKEAHIPLHRIYVTTIPDLNNNPLYVHHLQSYCPPFDTAYSNNPLMARLFTETGIPIRTTGDFDRGQLQGTCIRQRMVNNDAWETLLPPVVVKIIESLDGIRRLKKINGMSD